MKIESNRVIISSEKEFDDVSKICLANGRTWNDSDTTYNAIDGNNNAIIMLISSEKILYVRNVGFGEYKELSYSDFMNKYGDKQKRSNKMDSDIVRITSKEQLKRVEEICFDNKVYWKYTGKGHNDYYKSINLYIKIGHDSTEKDDKFAITQSSTLYDEETSMEYDEFINKYDKSNGDKMKIKPCRIKVTSKEEFKKYSDKKMLRKLIKKFDFFIAQASVMPKVATVFGRILGPTGKMPSPQLGIIINSDDKTINELKEKINYSIKIRVKEASIKLAIGKQSMKDKDIIENIITVYNAILKILPRQTDNIKNIEIKFTMTKPQKILIK